MSSDYSKMRAIGYIRRSAAASWWALVCIFDQSYSIPATNEVSKSTTEEDSEK